ncbi:hypothetical protein R1flu_021120 [Riccia fluitans]|uniref:RING-type E3 ubiquitin transferase n=1 Tax=Riccia fluitans TaxID=41844 RepID=A0ABD1ZNZ6_9MARC
MLIELIPIGTVLALITTEVLETALAAQDVLIEKETFRILSTYLCDIHPLLQELKKRELGESPTVRKALESLQEDLKKARALIDNCVSKSNLYLLVNCRSVVREAQEITRNLGKSLELLALASSEIASDISTNVSRLKDQMINAKFQTSESKVHVITKLEQGLREHRTDQGFANDLLLEIAKALGISVDTSAMSKELASFRREKEEAALSKEREEEVFMEQVISLLSRAESSHLRNSSRAIYFSRLSSLKDSVRPTEQIQPLRSFICPLNEEIMVDPVSLVTGSCFERSAITAWFAAGNTTDPLTHEELIDRTLSPNSPLRRSIEEWQELNYCKGILRAKEMLKSDEEHQQSTALSDLVELCEKRKAIKDWIAEEHIVVDVVKVLKSSNRDLKRRSLSALYTLGKDNKENKELLIEAGGLEQIVRCLSRDESIAKAAAALLLELLEGSESVSLKIGRQQSAIFLLVTLMNGEDPETAELARLTLDKLSGENENVVAMASASWFPPLVRCLTEGEGDATKLLMAKTLGNLKLTDEMKMTLGDLEVVPPLVRMMEVGNWELKLAGLKAVQSLSSHRKIKGCFAGAGGVPVVLNYLFSVMSPLAVRESSAIIVENLAENDGKEFFVDGSGAAIDEVQVVENLVAVCESSSNTPLIKIHVLRTLLGLLSPPGSRNLRDNLRSLRGISLLLPLIEGSEPEVRHCAIQMLFYLSENGGSEIAEYMKRQTKYKAFLKFLNTNLAEEVQVAAAGILVNLPQDDYVLTEALVEAEAISMLVDLLKIGTPKAKEAAVDALVRFTDPSNREMQQAVANLDVHPLLIRTILSGTLKSKARAATVLRNFSSSTPALIEEPKVRCTCFLSSRTPRCKVHNGLCDFKKTFCIVEADAVAGLIGILNEDRGSAAEAAVEALETLVSGDDTLHSGTQLLHRSGGITSLLTILSVGTPELKEKALRLVERIFKADEMAEMYGSRSRIPLVDLATSGSNSIKKRAARVLGELQFIHEISTYY